MLFNLVVDVFQQMVRVSNQLLESPLTTRMNNPIVALQYTDDIAIVARADASTLVTFKLILRLFTSISGLQVNFAKSTYIPINVEEVDKDWI